MQHYQNGYSKRIGDTGESAFLKFANELGWKCRKSTQSQDMREHIDYFVDIGGAEMSVDVKGLKRSAISGKVLIEILNVNGDHGWLFGRAEVLAFQSESGFILIEREKLCAYICRKMGDVSRGLDSSLRSFSKMCSAPFWYRRADRMDAITHISLAELERLA
jgi:hypothetical protein